MYTCIPGLNLVFIKIIIKCVTYYQIYYNIAGPIGLVNLMTAKACGASKVAITGE